MFLCDRYSFCNSSPTKSLLSFFRLATAELSSPRLNVAVPYLVKAKSVDKTIRAHVSKSSPEVIPTGKPPICFNNSLSTHTALDQIGGLELLATIK